MKFWHASMKTLTNFKIPSGNPLQTACWGIQEPAYDSVNYSVSRRRFCVACFSTSFHEDWLSAISKAELKLRSHSPLSELPLFSFGGVVGWKELVRICKDASRNIKNTFRDIQGAKKFNNHRRLYRNLTFKAFKKIIHLVTLSLFKKQNLRYVHTEGTERQKGAAT